MCTVVYFGYYIIRTKKFTCYFHCQLQFRPPWQVSEYCMSPFTAYIYYSSCSLLWPFGNPLGQDLLAQLSNVLLRCVNKVNKSKSFKTILWCDTVMNAMITILSSDVFWCVYRREQVLKDFNLITRYNITLFWLCMGTALSLACQLT